jgi:hypothetical protein
LALTVEADGPDVLYQKEDKMKKIMYTVGAILALALPAGAMEIAYNQYLVNAPLTTTNTYTLDMSLAGADTLSIGVAHSSGSPVAVTFNDGRASTDTLTVVSTQPLVGVQGSDTLTIISTASIVPTVSTNSVTISSNSFLLGATSVILLNGTSYYSGVNYFIGSSSAATASNVAAMFNSAPGNISATASFGLVSLSCVNAGTACNLYTLSTSSQAALTVSGPKFTGGVDNSYFRINNQQFTQGIDYVADVGYSSNTTISMKTAVNAANMGIVASTTSNVALLLQCSNFGPYCNSYTLVSSTPAAQSVTGANFAGGQFPATIQINGITLTQGVTQGPGVWAIGASTISTAVNISSCILNTPSVAAIVISTDNGKGMVITTTTAVGTNTNYNAFSSTPAAMTWGLPSFSNGANTAYSLTTSKINIPNHGLATGMEVWFSSSSNVGLSPLVVNTTYYAIAVDGNNVQLALTSTGAVAGTFIVLKSSVTTGPDTWGLNPLAMTGTMQVIPYQSNDCINFTPLTTTASNVTITSLSIASPWTAGNTFWDFGTINAKCVKFVFNGPTTGQENIGIFGYGKRFKW